MVPVRMTRVGGKVGWRIEGADVLGQKSSPSRNVGLCSYLNTLLIQSECLL
jgi:hypothetical protein